MESVDNTILDTTMRSIHNTSSLDGSTCTNLMEQIENLNLKLTSANQEIGNLKMENITLKTKVEECYRLLKKPLPEHSQDNNQISREIERQKKTTAPATPSMTSDRNHDDDRCVETTCSLQPKASAVNGSSFSNKKHNQVIFVKGLLTLGTLDNT
ncbi:unnamed protein product [Diatraea saccharalis]|uniref:Uncharacterized protein n=1 Tax=Diatraea saccharalis TaxID=40085 RepID=A0A9N9QWE8_9NEOP|nr:unnamed protein product [Diatraea saccharalis]